MSLDGLEPCFPPILIIWIFGFVARNGKHNPFPTHFDHALPTLGSLVALSEKLRAQSRPTGRSNVVVLACACACESNIGKERSQSVSPSVVCYCAGGGGTRPITLEEGVATDNDFSALIMSSNSRALSSSSFFLFSFFSSSAAFTAPRKPDKFGYWP